MMDKSEAKCMLGMSDHKVSRVTNVERMRRRVEDNAG